MTGGASTVKQFDSIANMQADPSPSNGDLATVYASTQSNFTEDTQTQFITFPETVILPSSIGEDYAQVQLQAVDESVMLDCWGDLSSERFNVSIYIEIDGDYKDYRIQYESLDGINYTRTRFESGGESLENPVDLTIPVKWGSRYGEATWNDLIGYFMIVGSTTYEGLYEYNGSNTQYELANTQLNTTSEDLYGNKVLYTNIGKITGALQNTDNLTLDQLKTRVNLYDDLSYLEIAAVSLNDVFAFRDFTSTNSLPDLNTSKVTNMHDMFAYCCNLVFVSSYDTSNVTDMSYMFGECNNLTAIPNFNTINVTNMDSMFSGCENLVSISNFDTSNVESMRLMFSRCGSIINIPNFNTSNVTDMSSMFFRCYNLTNVSNFDTSNVISMSYMFQNCNCLTNISNFNTSNVTDMSYMFSICHNLISVPNLNTINATNMYRMFSECYNLTDIPNFDTSNVVNMYSMFLNCNNLTSIPNFSMNKATSMYGMFQGCTNLVSVPQFYVPYNGNTGSIMMMFYMCNNLSNASIQNIVNMCLNSNITSTRRNLHIGNMNSPLYNTKFNNSYYQNRWSELTAAGWTY